MLRRLRPEKVETKSMTTRSTLFLALWLATAGTAQTPVPFGGTSDLSDRLPRSGQYVVNLHPRFEPNSLSQLVESSELIVEGVVLANLPAFNYNPKIPISIETDSKIAVNSLVKGSVDGEGASFLLVQRGGKVGDLEIHAANTSIVKSGDRYILFLRRDRREIPDTRTSPPRYDAVGIWSGLVRIENDRVLFADTAASSLRQNDNSSVDDFKTLLVDTLHYRVPPRAEDRPALMWPFQPGDPRGELPAPRR
jgi:hypothetical protein